MSDLDAAGRSARLGSTSSTSPSLSIVSGGSSRWTGRGRPVRSCSTASWAARATSPTSSTRLRHLVIGAIASSSPLASWSTPPFLPSWAFGIRPTILSTASDAPTAASVHAGQRDHDARASPVERRAARLAAGHPRHLIAPLECGPPRRPSGSTRLGAPLERAPELVQVVFVVPGDHAHELVDSPPAARIEVDAAARPLAGAER